jgi:hypothetical protein
MCQNSGMPQGRPSYGMGRPGRGTLQSNPYQQQQPVQQTPDPFSVNMADPYARQRQYAEGVPDSPKPGMPSSGVNLQGGGFAQPFQSEPNPAYGPVRQPGGDGFAMPSQSSPNPAYGPTRLDGGGYAMPGMEQNRGNGIVLMEGQSGPQRGAPLRGIPGRQGLMGIQQNQSAQTGGPSFQNPGGGPRGPAPTTPFQRGQVGHEWDTAGRGWIPQMDQGAVNYWGDMRPYAPQGFNPDQNNWIGSVQNWAPTSYDQWAQTLGRGYVNPYSR